MEDTILEEEALKMENLTLKMQLLHAQAKDIAHEHTNVSNERDVYAKTLIEKYSIKEGVDVLDLPSRKIIRK